MEILTIPCHVCIDIATVLQMISVDYYMGKLRYAFAGGDICGPLLRGTRFDFWKFLFKEIFSKNFGAIFLKVDYLLKIEYFNFGGFRNSRFLIQFILMFGDFGNYC